MRFFSWTAGDSGIGTRGESVVQDVRYGSRSLIRTPGFTAAALVALALGIGANAAIFSVIESVLLRPLPYEHPERLVAILQRGYNPVSPASFLDWQKFSHSFERMGAAEYWTPNLSNVDEPEKLYALRMTSDVLPMLGVAPLLGRLWSSEEDVAGRTHVAVLGYGLWMRRFGGDSSIVSRTVLLDGEPYTVLGVMPADFAFAPFWATRTEIWAPLPLGARSHERGGSLRVFAKRKPGVSLEQARAEMATITARLEREVPGSNRDIRVTDLTDQVVGDVRTPLLVLLGAVGFVLLIACANVAHMLLARGAARRRELAVRVALGARRSRIVRQLLTESLLLAAAGGALGLLLARGVVRLLASLGATSIPRVGQIAVDVRVLAATIAVALAAGVLFGLAPALRASTADLTGALKDGERGSTGGSAGNRVRDLLVASEFALALVLLVGAGLLIRSFVALQSLDAGFDPRNVLTMVVSVTGTSESEPGRRADFYDRVLDGLRASPGGVVRAASAVNHIPIGGDSWGWPFVVEGRPEPKPGETPIASYKVVLPGYFQTMGIALRAGRDVAPGDRLGAPGVVIVNEFLARRYWPGEEAIGKRLAFGKDSLGRPAWRTVVGVVANTIHGDWSAPPEEEAYLPFLQQRDYLESKGSHFSYMTVVLRFNGTAPVAAVRALVRSLDANVAIAEVQTLDSAVRAATARQRFYLVLLGAFAAAALALAAVGIYGVMSYAVSRRTHEIGLRIALGARPAQLRAQVVREGLRVAAIGALAGLAGALALSRVMATLLFGVRGTDPATYVAVAGLLGAVALVACYIPARRATSVDPLTALRAE